MVFFDTALESNPHALSIIATNPTGVLCGTSAHEEWQALAARVAERQRVDTPDTGMPCGFAAGFVQYDGSFCFGFYDELLVFRHADESWHSLGSLHEQMREEPGGSRKISTVPPMFKAEMERSRFVRMVQRAKEYIAAGDIYQVNLAHQFQADWQGDLWQLYSALRNYSPSPHASYLHLGGKTILSSSPELFLKISGRQICTRPIKGTRPRKPDQHADEMSAYDLITSPKEVAELVMITDLERNDLGKICEYGTVATREMLKLERYEQVFHLVSTVEGTLRAEIDAVTALRACFPGGSITGAPKKRAMEIIAELEPTPRGLYTGAIGYFGFNGESQFNIAIRTVVAEEGRAHFHVGAGIVADSIPEKEWQETLDKAAGILLAAERLHLSSDR
jgi:aminodeoxychorismate synthase component I